MVRVSSRAAPQVNHTRLSGLLTVVASAIRAPDGTVWSVPQPARHFHVEFKMLEADVDFTVGCKKGFTLSDGRFVGRAYAYEVAVAAGQCGRKEGRTELLSNDVW